jgi:Cytochrome c oxidase caa3 assembly factor (Caa3_CtaG)
VRSRLPRGRFWLAAVALALVLLSLVPPAATYARRYVFAESLQFLLFATVVPALLVLGAPWRRPGAPAGRGLAGSLAPAPGWLGVRPWLHGAAGVRGHGDRLAAACVR